MIYFVNAKINIGLEIVARRPDGYHNLQTLFYPVGLYAGTPQNPVRFCDILEVTPISDPRELPSGSRFRLSLTGRKVDCPLEKNLVWKAADLYFRECASPGFLADIRLEKHLPDGAGMGGGSADAAFTLRALAAEDARTAPEGFIPPDEDRLEQLALRLGADCPFFIRNRPAFATGVGEILTPSDIELAGWWLLAVKPRAGVSTKEAFSGIVPKPGMEDMRGFVETHSPHEWKGVLKNDFSAGLYSLHPEFQEIHDVMDREGSAYTQMTGSGSVIFSLWPSREAPAALAPRFESDPTIEAVYLLKL